MLKKFANAVRSPARSAKKKVTIQVVEKKADVKVMEKMEKKAEEEGMEKIVEKVEEIEEKGKEKIVEKVEEIEEKGKEKIVEKVEEIEENVEEIEFFDPKLVPDEPKPWSQWSLKDFEIGKPLGQGAFGFVYLARTKREKYIVALKVLHVKKIEELEKEYQKDIWKMVERETDIHLDLEHPNIISMHGYFKDEDKIVCVLEYSPGGDVYDELKRQPKGRFMITKAATYIHQITLALEYLHSKGIIHRDIKLENLLIGPFGEIKMADFGLSIKTGANNRTRKTFCGTMEYQAPEQVQNRAYTEKVDVWCVGILLYEFLAGETPFVSDSKDKTLKNISSGKYENPRNFHKLPTQAKDLIKKILDPNPKKRPTFSEIREHPFIFKNMSKSDEKYKLLPEIAEHFCKIDTPSYSAYFKDFELVDDL